MSGGRSGCGAHDIQGEAGRNGLFGLKKRRLWLRQFNAAFTSPLREHKGGARPLLDGKQLAEVAMWETPVTY